MPTTNIYYQITSQKEQLVPLLPELKVFIAQQLSCSMITLGPQEVSLRLIQTEGDGMLGEVEVEVKAHAFQERVQHQDEICLQIADYLMSKVSSFKNVKVWLVLAELGHSWK